MACDLRPGRDEGFESSVVFLTEVEGCSGNSPGNSKDAGVLESPRNDTQAGLLAELGRVRRSFFTTQGQAKLRRNGDMVSTGENDWDSLVDEMEQIKGRVEQTLDFSKESEGSPEPDASESPVSKGGEEYASMDEMLAGLGREEIEADTQKMLGSEPGSKGSKVVSLNPAPSSASGGQSAVSVIPESALSLAVVGALKLRLELTRENQTVQIHLEEAQLRVELSDGTQFRIPLNKAA
jgi:hypothetical protein